MNLGISNHVHHRDSIGRFAAAITEGEQKAIIQISDQGARTAAVIAPKRTGHMASTIQPFSTGGSSGGWRVMTPYAMAQEKGARPHKIGQQGQILANLEDGFFARGPVNHPGNPATHFMQKSYNIMKARMMGILKQNMP